MKPETLVIKRIRDALSERHADFELEKTNNSYSAGWLDLYVEAPNFVGWIEVKHMPTKPANGDIVSTAPILKKCSALQLKRMNRHLSNNIPTLLLCGFDGLNVQNRTYAIIPPMYGPMLPATVKVHDITWICDYLIRWTRPWCTTYD